MTRSFALLFTFICSASPYSGWAQTCQTSIQATASTAYFRENQDGSVTDLRTMLRWNKCSLGQRWVEQQCSGKAQLYSLKQSQSAAKDYKLGNLGNWRLPTLKELSMITESSCEQPAINLEVFPGTTSGRYWSSTPFINTTGQYWLVQLRYGENTSDKSSSKALVRLVRADAQ